MISDRYRCIFVHIPKTGGSSVEDVIWPGKRSADELWGGFVSRYRNRFQTGGLQHLFASHIRAAAGDRRFGAYYKFAIVRNPFDRAVSQYAFMSRRADLRDLIGMAADAPFERYLELIATTTHVQWDEQWKFVTDEAGRPCLDRICRFETLAADMAEVFARIGLTGSVLPHVRKGRRGPYRDYYAPAARTRLVRLYARDLELFGYDF